MRRHHHPSVKGPERGGERSDALHVEGVGRLVQQQEVRSGPHEQCKGDSLPLAPGEAAAGRRRYRSSRTPDAQSRVWDGAYLKPIQWLHGVYITMDRAPKERALSCRRTYRPHPYAPR